MYTLLTSRILFGPCSDALNGSPRYLANKTISGGSTAESCTSSCKAAGFVLAGFEFGGECCRYLRGSFFIIETLTERTKLGCDNYMARAVPAPDTDCNSVCDGDKTELCGAGNRLAVYQDTDAPPFTLQSCLTGPQLHVFNDQQIFPFVFRMVYDDPSANSAPVSLALIPNSHPFPIRAGETTVQFFQLSVSSDFQNSSHHK